MVSENLKLDIGSESCHFLFLFAVHDPALVRRQYGKFERRERKIGRRDYGLHKDHTIGRGGYGLHKEWPFIGRGGYGLHRDRAIGRGGYEISDLGRERTLGTGSLDTDLETSSRAFDRQLLCTLNDPYRKSILFDRLRATYGNSTFTSLYHKYGY